MRSRLQIRVLGELRVARDGKSLPLPASTRTARLFGCRRTPGEARSSLRIVLGDPRRSAGVTPLELAQDQKDNQGGGQDCLVADSIRVFLDQQAIDLDFMRVSRLRPNEVEMLETTALESLAGAFEGEFLEDLRLPHCPKFEAWRLYQANSLTRTRVQILRVLIDRTREQPERTLFYAHSLRSLNPERHAIPQEVGELISAPDRIVASPPR
jgi:hypothetical protein